MRSRRQRREQPGSWAATCEKAPAVVSEQTAHDRRRREKRGLRPFRKSGRHRALAGPERRQSRSRRRMSDSSYRRWGSLPCDFPWASSRRRHPPRRSDRTRHTAPHRPRQRRRGPWRAAARASSSSRLLRRRRPRRWRVVAHAPTRRAPRRPGCTYEKSARRHKSSSPRSYVNRDLGALEADSLRRERRVEPAHRHLARGPDKHDKHKP
jgi:hypothetical protein